MRWIEQASRNTAENARNARRLLDVDTILLVAQAMDMPRARMMFESAGFTVVPGPVGFLNRAGPSEFNVFDYFPDAGDGALDGGDDCIAPIQGCLRADCPQRPLGLAERGALALEQCGHCRGKAPGLRPQACVGEQQAAGWRRAGERDFG